MRLAGTAIICILAAFGAAFLVARAVNHESPAHAATPPPKTTNVADTTARVSPSHKVDVELISQFAPIRGPQLKQRPKPKPKHKKHRPKPVASITPAASGSTPTTPTYTTPAPTYTAPSYTPPAPTPTRSPTHKKKSGGSGGSGTTTIGG